MDGKAWEKYGQLWRVRKCFGIWEWEDRIGEFGTADVRILEQGGKETSGLTELGKKAGLWGGWKFSVLKANLAERFCLYLPVTAQHNLCSWVFVLWSTATWPYCSRQLAWRKQSGPWAELQDQEEQHMEYVVSLIVLLNSCLWDITVFLSATSALIID